MPLFSYVCRASYRGLTDTATGDACAPDEAKVAEIVRSYFAYQWGVPGFDEDDIALTFSAIQTGN